MRVPRRLITARLVLEATERRHADELWDGIRASLRELSPWISWAPNATLDEELSFTRAAEKMWTDGTGWPFTIRFKDRAVGHIGLQNFKPLIASAEMGYWIRSDVGGRGVMTEAASAVVEFGFDEIGLHRIELRASPHNGASVRVAEKIGFTREGLLRDGSRGGHGYHDVYIYGLLAGDERTSFHQRG